MYGDSDLFVPPRRSVANPTSLPISKARPSSAISAKAKAKSVLKRAKTGVSADAGESTLQDSPYRQTFGAGTSQAGGSSGSRAAVPRRSVPAVSFNASKAGGASTNWCAGICGGQLSTRCMEAFMAYSNLCTF